MQLALCVCVFFLFICLRAGAGERACVCVCGRGHKVKQISVEFSRHTCRILISIGYRHLQVALKRQQAVEDAIALRLVANKTGRQIDALPPGSIFGLSVTRPAESSEAAAQTVAASNSPAEHAETKHSQPEHEPLVVAQDLSAPRRESVSQTAIDMLAQLFPQRKRSVLELVLKRCDLDLIRAIENVSPPQPPPPPMEQAARELAAAAPPPTALQQLALPMRSSAFRPVIAEQQQQQQQQFLEKPSSSSLTSAAAAAAICAYPKWFVPLSFPVTMGHLSNLAPRCTLPNCNCLESYQFH